MNPKDFMSDRAGRVVKTLTGYWTFIPSPLPPKIEYIDMPEKIRGQYQYFTEAKVESLLRAGYNAGFTSLEDGVKSYVTKFLNTADRYR